MKTKYSPHVHTRNTARIMYADMLIAQAPVVIMAVLYYGLRPLVLAFSAALAAGMVSFIINYIFGRREEIMSFSIFSGFTAALLCPSTMGNLWLVLCVAFSTAAAVLFRQIKSLKRLMININAPALSVCLLALFFAGQMLRYPPNTSISSLPIAADAQQEFSVSLLSMLNGGLSLNVTFNELIVGLYSGPMGTTCIPVLLAAAIYLIYRRAVARRCLISFFAVYATAVTLLNLGGDMNKILFELCVILFSGVFLVGLPKTAPKSATGRLVFGALTGLLAFGFRLCSFYMAVPFAVFIVSLGSSYIDLGIWYLSIKKRKKKFIV